jgi:hypothetical protein
MGIGVLKNYINGVKDASNHVVRLERARQEGIAEMILKSITGMDRDVYRVELSPEANETALQKQAIALERTSHRFYLDTADKIPVKEVVRT